jgi:hypothetical protein
MANKNTTDERLDAIERRSDSTEHSIRQIEERALPISWKACVGVVSAFITLLSAGIGFYVFYTVPGQINERVNPIVATLNEINKKVDSTKPPDREQIVELNKSLQALQELIKSNSNELDRKIIDSEARLNGRIDDLLLALAKDPGKTKISYRRAIAVKPRDLAKSLPVAKELLTRARQQGTTLSLKEIKELAIATVPLLDKTYKDPEMSRKVLNTASELATYKTFVVSKQNPAGNLAGNSCKDGNANLGGVALENQIYVNCKVSYLGGDIILKNVQFINTEFAMVDEPSAKQFLKALLLSDKSTISIDTSSRSINSSE